MILAGRVRVNGRVVRELGTEADVRTDKIEALGEIVKPEPLRYYLFHKPDCVITSVSDPAGRRTVMDYFRRVRERVFPVGRLDYHSEGLLLVTNDGQLDFILTHPCHEVQKEYDCLLYTSDAADEEDSVDLGGRRIIHKKKKKKETG